MSSSPGSPAATKSSPDGGTEVVTAPQHDSVSQHRLAAGVNIADFQARDPVLNRRSTEAVGASGATQQRWWRELTGGLAGALAAFSIAVPLGALAFAPLGPAFAGLGVVSALVGSALGALIVSRVSNNPALRSGPMTALCLIVNGVVATLLLIPGMGDANAAGVPRALTLAFACIALAGVVQILFGVLKLGHAIKYVPRPVLSGFRLGLATIIIVSQIPPMLGLDRPLGAYSGQALVDAALPWSLAVSVFTIAAIVAARRAGLKSVALFVGLIGGALAHFALLATHDAAELGATIGTLPTLNALPGMWRSLFDIAPAAVPASALFAIVGSAIGIALVGSVLTLLAARSVEDLAGARGSGNRELIGQGLGNLIGAVLGGQPVAGSPATSVATYHGGGRTWVATLWTSVLLLAGVMLAGRWIAAFPLAALAGVMFVIATDLLDREPLKVMNDLRRRGTDRHEAIVDLAIIGAVAIASLMFNIGAGVLVGVLIAVAVFAIKSSRNVVRRYSAGTMRRSFRQRGQRETEILRAFGSAIALFELEGPIFFGTAERLADEVAKHAPGARFVILDFGRVNGVDATGAHVIDQLARRLRDAEGRLVIASLSEQDARRRSLERGLPREHAQWLPDADRALEWCEERLLAEHSRIEANPAELPLEHIDLCRGLNANELALLRDAVTRETHPKGTVLFHEGDAGNCVYLLARGAVTILLETSSSTGNAKRIVTFAPGVTFGELAILDGSPRSAAAVCDREVVVFVLSTAALDSLRVAHPQLAIKLYQAMAQGLASRLRATTSELHHVAGG